MTDRIIPQEHPAAIIRREREQLDAIDPDETCRFCDSPVWDSQRFTDHRGRLFCSQKCLSYYTA